MVSSALARWRENMIAPFEWGSGMFPLFAPEIRVEQLIEDGHYVVRAEIPGVDPVKDVEVTVDEGILKIQVERTEEKRDKAHSEFHYGRFMRTLPLPLGTVEDSVSAKYANGVLEITFTMGEPKVSARHVEIDVAKKTV